MDDICAYRIQVRGAVAKGDIDSFSPPGLVLECLDDTSTWLTIHADQAGMIGLIRNLHGLGFVLLTVNRCAAEPAPDSF